MDHSKHYLAFVISPESREELIRLFKPKFSRVICHHVTIEFNVADGFDLSEFISKPYTVKAIGVAQGDGVECIAVSINGVRERIDGSFYHITLSVEPPHKPVESNTLKDKVSLIRGIVPITGSFQLVRK